jgi:hypothetical protein
MTGQPTQHTAIPFVGQQPIDGNHRTCAAAALAMVYGSLGCGESQNSIWQRIVTGATSTDHIATYQLARDALDRGLAAVVLRAGADPIAPLKRLLNTGWRAVVNHRLATDQRWGHFSVVVAADDRHVVLHDPQRGPHCVYSHDDWLRLWQPAAENTEATGLVVVAIARPRRSAVQTELVCPRCDALIQLAEDLLRTAAERPNACWECLFCPRCDAALCLPSIQCMPAIRPLANQPRRTA